MAKNITIVVLALLVVYFIWYTSTRKCFYLPTTGTPSEWGSFYWKSFHEIADRIPCEECRTKGSSFLVFMHDMVNRKLSKPIKDQANMDFWINYISGIKNNQSSSTSTQTAT